MELKEEDKGYRRKCRRSRGRTKRSVKKEEESWSKRMKGGEGGRERKSKVWEKSQL